MSALSVVASRRRRAISTAAGRGRQPDDRRSRACIAVVAASYLARPGEHAVGARLLSGFRACAVLVGVCALCVAAIFGLGLVQHPTAARLDCWPAHGPAAVRGQRTCAPAAGMAADVPPGVQHVADGATLISMLLAVP